LKSRARSFPLSVPRHTEGVSMPSRRAPHHVIPTSAARRDSPRLNGDIEPDISPGGVCHIRRARCGWGCARASPTCCEVREASVGPQAVLFAFELQSVKKAELLRPTSEFRCECADLTPRFAFIRPLDRVIRPRTAICQAGCKRGTSRIRLFWQLRDDSRNDAKGGRAWHVPGGCSRLLDTKLCAKFFNLWDIEGR